MISPLLLLQWMCSFFMTSGKYLSYATEVKKRRHNLYFTSKLFRKEDSRLSNRFFIVSLRKKSTHNSHFIRFLVGNDSLNDRMSRREDEEKSLEVCVCLI